MHQACQALCKRGLNVGEMCPTLGPGGVGLTMTTKWLTAMYGPDNCKIFDPNIFYTDDELRKVVEDIATSIIPTAQERPTMTYWTATGHPRRSHQEVHYRRGLDWESALRHSDTHVQSDRMEAPRVQQDVAVPRHHREDFREYHQKIWCGSHLQSVDGSRLVAQVPS